MYSIKHLPSNTLYGIKHSKSDKHTIVYFNNYENAKITADSLATYMNNNKYPPASDTLYLLPKHVSKQAFYKEKLWIEYKTLNYKHIKDLGNHNLDFLIVNNIIYHDNGTYNLEYKHFKINPQLQDLVNTLNEEMELPQE